MHTAAVARSTEAEKGLRGAPGLTRRVQRTGLSSLSVTLPKSWTDSMNLEVGDALRFRDLGQGRLELSPAKTDSPDQPREKLLRIDASDAPPNLIARLLIGGYITGQDHIVVRARGGLSADQRREVRRTVAHVLGMTVVEESADSIEVQNFVDPGRYQLHRLLGQVVRILRSELASCLSVLSGSDGGSLDQLGPLEDEVDRFYLLMVRQLLLSSDDFQVARDIGVESHHYQIGYRLLAKVIEVTGDLVAGVGEELKANLTGFRRFSTEDRGELAGLLRRFEDRLGRTMDAFDRLSVVEANTILNEISESHPTDSSLGDTLARRVKDRQVAVAAQRIVSNVLMGTEMLVVVNEVTINRSVEPETVAGTDRQVRIDRPRAS